MDFIDRILLDDNNRRTICRLWFNGGRKYLGLFSPQGEEERIAITELDDIYTYAERLKATLERYEAKPVPSKARVTASA